MIKDEKKFLFTKKIYLCQSLVGSLRRLCNVITLSTFLPVSEKLQTWSLIFLFPVQQTGELNLSDLCVLITLILFNYNIIQ